MFLEIASFKRISQEALQYVISLEMPELCLGNYGRVSLFFWRYSAGTSWQSSTFKAVYFIRSNI